MGIEIIEFWKRMNGEGRRLLLTFAKDILSHEQYTQNIVNDINSQFNKALELGNSGCKVKG